MGRFGPRGVETGSRKPKRLIGINTAVRCDVDDSELASCQRASLIEDHGRQTASLFETTAIADQQP